MNNQDSSKNILKDKSYKFALRVIKLNQFLVSTKSEYILSKQIIRSGTAIGALVREAEYGQSRPDFISKMSIALKEANETEYWICLLQDSNFIGFDQSKSLKDDCTELIKLLISTIKTSKSKN